MAEGERGDECAGRSRAAEPRGRRRSRGAAGAAAGDGGGEEGDMATRRAAATRARGGEGSRAAEITFLLVTKGLCALVICLLKILGAGFFPPRDDFRRAAEPTERRCE